MREVQFKSINYCLLLPLLHYTTELCKTILHTKLIKRRKMLISNNLPVYQFGYLLFQHCFMTKIPQGHKIVYRLYMMTDSLASNLPFVTKNLLAESVEQDQPAHTWSLILLCTLRWSVINICRRTICNAIYLIEKYLWSRQQFRYGG